MFLDNFFVHRKPACIIMAEIMDACGREEWERAELLFDEDVAGARVYRVRVMV